jgi:tetratricopeptide (TPR) repeat protein
MKTFSCLSLMLMLTALAGSPASANPPLRSTNLQSPFLVSSNRSELNVKVQPLSFFEQGIDQAVRGNFLSAIQNYDLALQQMPDNADIYYNRGVAHYSVGHTVEAMQDFNRAISLNPDLAEAYGNRGVLRIQQGDRQGAVQDYQKAVQLFTQQGDVAAAQQMREFVQQNLSQ